MNEEERTLTGFSGESAPPPAESCPYCGKADGHARDCPVAKGVTNNCKAGIYCTPACTYFKTCKAKPSKD